jgi:hypothetical protein
MVQNLRYRKGIIFDEKARFITWKPRLLVGELHFFCIRKTFFALTRVKGFADFSGKEWLIY